MSCGCPNGWNYFDKSCYLKNDDKVDYKTALNRCKSFGGQLVILNSINEENHLSSYSSTNNNNHFWVGADVYAARNLHWFENSSFKLPWCPSNKIFFNNFSFIFLLLIN